MSWENNKENDNVSKHIAKAIALLTRIYYGSINMQQ